MKLGKKERTILTINAKAIIVTIWEMKKFFLSIFLITFIVYFFTSGGTTPYNYFTRLADAFLHGKYYITDNPPWLNELIQIGNGRFTFVNPPMPAFLAIPFVGLFGKDFPQNYLANIVGAVTISLVSIFAYLLTKNKKIAIFTGVLLGFGSIFWYLSSTGSVWYLGQITATMFISGALIESFSKKRPFVIGLLVSGALLSRLQLMPSLIFFLTVISAYPNKNKIKNYIKFFLGLLLFVLTYLTYNWLRFENPLQTGYTLIAGLLQEPYFNYGQFSLKYIPKQLSVFLLALPKIKNSTPYIYPSWAGLAVWITSPVFISILKAPLKDKLVIASWISILGIGLINFSYGSTGFSQFGYRYAVDFYPFMIFLMIKSLQKTGLKNYHWILLVISIFVNLWGVLWLNKFGWGSY